MKCACGADVPPRTGCPGRSRKWCSDACRVRRTRKRKRVPGVCRCGLEFIGLKGQHYCSCACAHKFAVHRKAKPRGRCEICGAEKANTSKRFCSRACSQLIPKGCCPQCGKQFKGMSHAKFCSPACQRVARDQRWHGIRRARIRGVQRESIDRVATESRRAPYQGQPAMRASAMQPEEAQSHTGGGWKV